MNDPNNVLARRNTEGANTFNRTPKPANDGDLQIRYHDYRLLAGLNLRFEKLLKHGNSGIPIDSSQSFPLVLVRLLLP